MDALTKTTGPCIVLAGAGTGKTHLMVEKVKYLIKNRIYAPEKIACITFSNEAANNLSSRIRKALPFLEKEPLIKTFHSLSAHILKNNLPKEKQNFQTLTPDDAKILIHTALKVQPMNCHRYIDAIGKAKDLGITLASLRENISRKTKGRSITELKEELELIHSEILTEPEKDRKRKLVEEAVKIREILELTRFVTVFEAYEKIKQQRNALDYSDLNNLSVELLRQDQKISEEFDYVIVDEFQDTNRVQLEFLGLLAPHKNITVVGDMNQSIYRFRGAYEANMKSFRKMFDVAEENIFTLERSYRSPNKILQTAHQLISNNYESKEECIFIKNAFDHVGDKIRVIETKNGNEEARKIVEIVQDKIATGLVPEEICIMARTHQQLLTIRRALTDANIKFHSVGQESLLKQSSIKKITSYLSVVNNLTKKSNAGWNSWWELIHEEKFPKEDFIKLTSFLREHKETENYNVKIFTTLPNIELSEVGKSKLESIFVKIKTLIPQIGKPLNELLEIATALCNPISEELSLEEKEVLLNIDKFREFAKKYSETHAGKINDFLDYIEILNLLNITIETSKIEDKGIRLMTSHATKGLEYNTVILTNLAQKRFPLERAQKNKLLPEELISKPEAADLEEYEKLNQLFEERRLCYVSFTRSKSELILTYAQEYAGKKTTPSQFLEEINYKENENIEFIQDLEEKAITFDEGINQTTQEKNPEADEKTFSPSALILFEDCQKKFEYKYIYNMPEKLSVSWDALKTGSFIHIILERGVKENFNNLEEFINLAKDLKNNEEWESIELDEVLPLIKTFYDRNKQKYSQKSLTEQRLFATLAGLKFMGVADRIDLLGNGIEIIDYKTGKTVPSGKERNWQLGFYALAARHLGNVKKLTLDVFQNPIPIEFTVKENGDVISLSSNRLAFNIHEVEAELIEAGNKIKNAYKNGFKPCPPEKNCAFCNEYVY